MKAVTGREMCKALERAGWTLKRIKSSHHHYERPGDPRIVSVPVHAGKTLKPGMQHGIMRKAGLTEADL